MYAVPTILAREDVNLWSEIEISDPKQLQMHLPSNIRTNVI